MDLYDANTRRATGAIVRDVVEDEASLVNANAAALKVSGRAWETLPQLAAGPDNDACRVLLDASGELVAYAWIGRSGWWVQSRERHAPESFHLGEVMARDSVAADAVITAARMWASEVAGDARQIEFITPPDGPVAQAAAYQGGIFVGRHTREGEFMARVLDLDRFFRQMQPELSARIRASRAEFEGTLVFRTDEGEASIVIANDGVSLDAPMDGDKLVIDLPQETLARLSLGAFEVRDLLARLPVQPSTQVLALLEILFPRRTPHIHAMDRF